MSSNSAINVPAREHRAAGRLHDPDPQAVARLKAHTEKLRQRAAEKQAQVQEPPTPPAAKTPAPKPAKRTKRKKQQVSPSLSDAEAVALHIERYQAGETATAIAKSVGCSSVTSLTAIWKRLDLPIERSVEARYWRPEETAVEAEAAPADDVGAQTAVEVNETAVEVNEPDLEVNQPRRRIEYLELANMLRLLHESGAKGSITLCVEVVL